MRPSSVITIGSSISFEIKNSIDSDEVIRVKSMIQGHDDKIIMVNLPTNGGVPVIPSADAEIKAIIPIDAAGLCMFYVKLVDKVMLDGIPCLSFKIDSDIKKAQRRQYFRLNYIGHVNISIDEFEDELSEYIKQDRVSSRVVEETVTDNGHRTLVKFLVVDGRDISGGGFRAHCRMPFNIGTKIHGVIELDDEQVTFNGEIVRCKPVVNEIDNFEIGVSFSDIDENVRSKIISFIFQKQRRMMKK